MLLVLSGRSARIMGEYRIGLPLAAPGWTVTLAMFLNAAGFLYTTFVVP